MWFHNTLEEHEVPPPPADAVRNYGDPPYQQKGYVIDDGACRWRYRGPLLIGFMVYASPDRTPIDGKVWSAWWFRGRGY